MKKLKYLYPGGGLPLVFCVRNELARLDYFLGYYRTKGVTHFLIVDNNSDDGTREFLLDQPDCSVWTTDASYKAANFGMDWCNALIDRHVRAGWVICCDPDEFLIYPSCENRSIVELIRHLDRIEQRSLFCTMLDTYGRGRLAETRLEAGQNPLDLIPYFDLTTPSQRIGEKGLWLQGGVRMRVNFRNHPANAPAINKVPLIKWAPGMKYLSSMHHTNVPEINYNLLNQPSYVSGCLFHFKFVSSLGDKASEEMERQQHFNDSAEYKRYLAAQDLVFYDERISYRYKDSADLERLGFMQRGNWF